jgi:fructuronate reductase
VRPRLRDLAGLPPDVGRPAYDRAALRPGILHLGLGAFHRAHQAPCTDDAIAAAGGDWGIEGVSLRSADAVDRLGAQNGLYTLLVRGPEGTGARVVGAILATHLAPRAPRKILERLADPAIRIVSLTVTEKAYGLDPATGGLDLAHPAVRADLGAPEAPEGTLGYLVEGLARRRTAGLAPFTPLCCDNLPSNGAVLRRLVLEFAERREPALRRWIEALVPFPSTMVDRITPASTDATYEDAARLIGREDRAAVETEPFWQWVIEDRFTAGRPAWDAAGALFVSDVAPYEKMKLRMLNGAHSLLAYLGFLDGREFVRDVMADPALRAIVRAHMGRAALTLDPVPGIDLDRYTDELCTRFANPAIAHATYQIAMDGTQKLPQRLLEPAVEALRAGRDVGTFALAVAAWMRYALGEDERGRRHALRDPREAEITAALAGTPRTGGAIADRLLALPGLFPPVLLHDGRWRAAVAGHLDAMLQGGVRAALERWASSGSNRGPD